ncbi:MAG: hypothetical protein KDD33_04505 [Bdellovibrionales bacterium]|nr:hypothetical protein [Bdellovibrionales bacterium]
MKKWFLSFLILAFTGSASASMFVQDSLNLRKTPWSFTGFSIASLEPDQLSDGGGRLQSYNYASINYRLSMRDRVSLRLPFNYNTAGYDRFNGECVQNQEWAVGDPIIGYTNYNLVLLPGEIDTFWNGRIYLPVSNTSQDQGRILRARNRFIFSRMLTQKLEIAYRDTFNYYHQAKTTYVGKHADDQCNLVDNDNPSNTKKYDWEQLVALWYSLGKNFGISWQGGMRTEMRNASNTIETSRQAFGRLREISAFMGPAIRFSVSDDINMILTYYDVAEFSGYREDRQDLLSDLGTFKSKNTEISLLTFFRF